MDLTWLSVGLSGLAACLAALGLAVASRTRRDPALAGLTDALDHLRQDLGAVRTALSEDLRRGRDETGLQAHQLRDGLDGAFARLREETDRRHAELRQVGDRSGQALREEVATQVRGFGDLLGSRLDASAATQKERLEDVAGTVRRLTQANAEAHEGLRGTVEARLEALRQENAAKLEEMRRTVDEKLQGTLEERLGEKFKLVSDQLANVFRSVGEMQTLAQGVGDLKRVLTNVKSRGTWAEVSLGAVLEQVLAPDQFCRNVEVRPGSGERVEYAVRLPGQGEGERGLLLPIDAKFPVEDYERLLDASDRADAAAIEAALKGLETRIKAEGVKICAKYVVPPHTTDFGILYLPTEGLYAEVIRRPGLVDHLQGQCRIVVAGPTVLLAILNSLRMGFRTLAIQQRSSEVWQTLAGVKSEFSKYGEVLDQVKKKLVQASEQIDKVATRRNAIDRKLRDVEALPDAEAGSLLALAPLGDAFLDAAE